MEYFRINKKGNDLYIHFFNRRRSIYSSLNRPNLLEKFEVKPSEFVKKINNLFTKYKIIIPKDFPKHSDIKRKIGDKKVDDFPIIDFLMCLHCCILLEDEYGIDTSKILRWELIKPNSNRGIQHACSMAVIAFNYLKKKYSVSIPREKKNELNPDLIIDNLRCEVKTIQEADWEGDIDPDTGFGKLKTRGPDL